MVRTVASGTAGWATLTHYGRQRLAADGLRKGESFIAAAILLRRSGGHPQVVAHLYLQGLEIVLKCVLQIVDPARYSFDRLRKRFGHDVGALLDECFRHKALKWRPRGFVASAAFVSLCARYTATRLRYPGVKDWFPGYVTLPEPLITFVAALVKWARRAAARRGLTV